MKPINTPKQHDNGERQAGAKTKWHLADQKQKKRNSMKHHHNGERRRIKSWQNRSLT